MNDINHRDKREFIKSKEEYKNLIDYLEGYIVKLLHQPKIKQKSKLKLVLHELHTKGFINSEKRYDFFRSLLMYEKYHRGTDIDLRVYDLRRFRTSSSFTPLPLT